MRLILTTLTVAVALAIFAYAQMSPPADLSVGKRVDPQGAAGEAEVRGDYGSSNSTGPGADAIEQKEISAVTESEANNKNTAGLDYTLKGEHGPGVAYLPPEVGAVGMEYVVPEEGASGMEYMMPVDGETGMELIIPENTESGMILVTN